MGDLAQTLQDLRKSAGLSRRQLEEVSEVSEETIKNVEYGRNDNPTPGTLRKIAAGIATNRALGRMDQEAADELLLKLMQAAGYVPSADPERDTRIGRRVADARRDRGWDQTELARRAGVAGSYISRLENGKFTSPSADRLARIADALGRRLTDLTEPPAPPDEDEDATLRRLLEAKIGRENAPIIAGMLPKLQGLDPDEVQKLAEIVSIMLSRPRPRADR